MKRRLLWVLLGAYAFTSTARGQAPREELVDQVGQAIERGVGFLKQQEKGEGHWERDVYSVAMPGGMTAMALLALMQAGIPANDPIIERGLRFLRAIPLKNTYVVALTVMVYAEAGNNVDRERIQRGVDWLITTRVMDGDQCRGWGYGSLTGTTDNSNAQYALLGLYAGHQAGAKVDRAIWQSIQDFYTRTQLPGENGWNYPGNGNSMAEHTMTTAGICGLLISGLELNPGREEFAPNGVVSHCGQYAENAPLRRALAWLDRNFKIDTNKGRFYNLYGIERTGRLTGRRYFGKLDWYREGCDQLVKSQHREDGSWYSGGLHDGSPIVSTSFALLFLSKGRTPVLISKLVHGPGEDWNNDRNDARRLTEYCSREVFPKLPLAWQVFDVRGQDTSTKDRIEDLVRQLLQSPIAYINGHLPPQFSEAELILIKNYVEQGGFLLAEACCNRPEFDKGFRALMQQLFPDNPLKPLPPEHPIWRAHAQIAPGSYPLEGIEYGCKTVVVYSPRDLSCYWEGNLHKTGQGQLAFRLGANIVAYATGLEPPKPRLTGAEFVQDDPEGKQIPRGYIKAAQLRHEGDWQPAPNAMRNLLAHMRGRARLDVALQTKAMAPGDPELSNFRFLYMHGRSNFTFAPSAIKNLRMHLETGGLLFADACCGKPAFDESFRAMAAQIFPDKKWEPIASNDDLFSEDLNSVAVTNVRLRTENGGEYQLRPPVFEGMRLGNRWAIIYSKFDLGCALEKHRSSDCLGYDNAGALQLGSAVVLYYLKR